MSDLKKTTVAAFLGSMVIGLNIQLPIHSEPISECQKVNYPIGLNIRSAPSSSSSRLSSIAYGLNVSLDGKLKKPGRGSATVTPTIVQDSEGTTWIKIKAPVPGWVLFTTGNDIDSLISCQSNSNALVQNESSEIELKVYSQNEQKQSCPDKVFVTEQSRPYQEGSFATDGSVNLSAYASDISILTENNFSATWVGKLKPQYVKCLASAGMTKVDGQDYSGNINYLRMHFFQGRVYFILDLAGGFDPNAYPLVVLENSLKNGNPAWTWGGSD